MNPDPQPPPTDQPKDPYYGGPLGAGIDWSDPNSSLAPFYFSTGGVIAIAVLGVAFFILSILPLWHTDFWAHLKYGDWIVANRTLPEREPLSPFTDKQRPMFDAMWLSQVGYHATFQTGQAIAGGDDQRRLEGGVELIRLLHLAAVVLAVGLFALAYRRVADSVPWAIGGMVFVLIFMLGTLATQRPQTLALTCYASLLCMLSRPGLSRRAMFGIPVLMILWANLHGSFVIGFGLLGIVFLGRVIGVIGKEGLSIGSVWKDEVARRLAIALLACVVGVALLNPYGPLLYVNVFRFGGHPNLRTMAEWQPLDFSQIRGGHWSYLALALIVLVSLLATRRMITSTQLLLVLAFGLWPVLQQRMMTWWIPLVPWIIALHWVAASERWGLKLPENASSFRKTALAALLAVVVVFASPATTWLKTGKPRPVATALHKGTPHDIAAALKGVPPASPDRVAQLVGAIRQRPEGRFVGPVFCSESQGEYLLWSLPPDTPVMMFNHAQLFTPDYWSDCLAVKQAELRWGEILERHRANLVIVEVDYHPRLCDALRVHPDWHVLLDEVREPGRDADSRLFVALRRAQGGP